jgi:nucleotide-binding universal stress UspA family protein
MYKRVLIPLDGSRLAEGILPLVLQIAGPLDLEVVLVRVMEPVAPQAIEGTSQFTVDHVAARLDEAQAYLVQKRVSQRFCSAGSKRTRAAREGAS